VRLFVPITPPAGQTLTLPAEATRHAQVRRVQPGDALVLFDGSGAEWPATVQAVRRDAVDVQVGSPAWPGRELAPAITLAVVVPANERMDWLVEKATELGAAALQPLLAERSVLRLDGERAPKRVAHWEAIVRAASAQCGRTRLMTVAPVLPLQGWLATLPALPGPGLTPEPGAGAAPTAEPTAEPAVAPARWLLSLADDALPPARRALPQALTLLSGPEGGLSAAEERAARAAGFWPVSLGPRVLRAETAPLALLAWAALAG
jgi:16S rRNA (uracil1498-N3)-methyltransferase